MTALADMGITLTLHSDASGAIAALNELSSLLDPWKAGGEVAERFFERFVIPSELIFIEGEVVPAGRAGETVVRFHPTERLLRLLAALRACDGDLGFVEKALCHDGSSTAGLNHPAAATPIPSKTGGAA